MTPYCIPAVLPLCFEIIHLVKLNRTKRLFERFAQNEEDEGCLLNAESLQTDFYPKGTMRRHGSLLVFFLTSRVPSFIVFITKLSLVHL